MLLVHTLDNLPVTIKTEKKDTLSELYIDTSGTFTFLLL